MKFKKLIQKVIVISLVVIFRAFPAFALSPQATPVGIFESLLGNSGAALSDSSAPSFYNPSLLSLKKENSHSVSGHTFNYFSGESSIERVTSVGLYPTYLGSIFVTESLAHELFIYGDTPTRNEKATNVTASGQLTQSESVQDITKLTGGYSMAFRSFGFAMSYFGQITQIKEQQFIDQRALAGDLRTQIYTRGNLFRATLGMSLSGHNDFDGYRLGYNLKVKPVTVSYQNKTSGIRYIRGETLPSDFRTESVIGEISYQETDRASLSIGHSFQNGDHEFLTDTNFSEITPESATYRVRQTFGYRMTDESGHQLMAGASHGVGSEVKYLGQDAYLSVGYSWSQRTFRSTFGIYYSRLQEQDLITNVGMSFGSEIGY